MIPTWKALRAEIEEINRRYGGLVPVDVAQRRMLDTINRAIETQMECFAHEKARLEYEAKAMRAETESVRECNKADHARGRDELKRIRACADKARAALTEARASLADVRQKTRAEKENIAALQIEAQTLKASLASALEDAERTRRTYEEQLAVLRAYPVAKVEAWTKKRQAMDPQALPRFAETSFTGVSG